MDTHDFTGFKIDLIPNSPETPMILIFDGVACCSIELPSIGEFHVFPADDRALYHLVQFKMDGAKNNPPEIDFHVPVSEMERFKKTSLLPVIS
ncbi:conserved hypothetical protein [Vibrio chagasii]|nr:conserved hypothetical protein [Vibrio chagasii]